MDDNMPTGETMNEGSDIPPTPNPAPKPKAPMGPQISVPLKSLAMPGEDEQMNTPGMGDVVEFHAQGKVASIQGDNAMVALETVNGDPVTPAAAATNDTPGADEFAQLRQESAGRMM